MEKYNIDRIITEEIFSSIPTCNEMKEASISYKGVIEKEIRSFSEKLKYNLEKAARAGEFHAKVVVSPEDAKYIGRFGMTDYFIPILKDRGYKVTLLTCNERGGEISLTINW